MNSIIQNKEAIAKVREYYEKHKHEYYFMQDKYVEMVLKRMNEFANTYEGRRDVLDRELYILEGDYEVYGLEQGDSVREDEIDEIIYFNNEICRLITPIGKDNSRHISLGGLLQNYNLNINDLYFDVTGNCIRDEKGNVGAD